MILLESILNAFEDLLDASELGGHVKTLAE